MKNIAGDNGHAAYSDLVVALIAVGLVFNAGGLKDVFLELFNKIIGVSIVIRLTAFSMPKFQIGVMI